MHAGMGEVVWRNQADSVWPSTSVGALVGEVGAVHEEGAIEAAPKHCLRMHEVHGVCCKAAAHELEDRARPCCWQQQVEAQQGHCQAVVPPSVGCPWSDSAVRHTPNRTGVLQSYRDPGHADQGTSCIAPGTQVVRVLARTLLGPGSCIRSLSIFRCPSASL